MLKLLAGLGEDDFVLALVSGGGSALLVQPAGDITLAEKQAVNDALLASGAPIGEMNIVRKHLSRVKGGQLAAAAWPARMLALMISDIPGDDPALIASGPTVGDDSTPADARAILDRWHIAVPPSVEAVLAAPTGVLPPDAPALARTENRVIAAPAQSLAAAAAQAEVAGCEVRTPRRRAGRRGPRCSGGPGAAGARNSGWRRPARFAALGRGVHGDAAG